ncbi:hypothetical protein PESP_a1353 [Pseudoalteromonas espejiana DSM 9414]|nr:hypothetical protein PESP_a1353 [Pseudoalteromonas espejiana DSM 9414]
MVRKNPLLNLKNKSAFYFLNLMFTNRTGYKACNVKAKCTTVFAIINTLLDT